MNNEDVRRRGLMLLGCGKMGSAMLQGWLSGGLPAEAVTVLDPHPSDWLHAQGVRLNEEMPADPAVVLVAVKPQMMEEALPRIARFGGGETLVVSVAAGTPIKRFEDALGAETPVVRAMPNTPAAVGRGITAIIGSARVSDAQLDLAERLLEPTGQVVRLESETQMDAVTGVSGSGPAYVFHMVEALALAGEAQGLPSGLAMDLARATVTGAGALLDASEENAEQLRINVTSPGGTTAAALEVLMSEEDGLPVLMCRAVGAAADRSRELGK
ncbi:pyrroline-5-carboxylate reductase [Tropicimonas isoalkanivorans]|uniref:Pyrroline-5-carboxylate reductase n=1 Tax=Tropicimonas isoalkanivorans TaxID=441112 RepID=A0A1I1QBC0_9RHOB|nr:pyrroline-5-carboxylate reductase [Tropicimonas isoalkanivorans]SFD19297.1 pyrroline-5-carboxylate reductase [Tropicimonas isoalkanivorans]